MTPEIFWSRVAWSEDIGVCWPWLGRVDNQGYGSIADPDLRAHRVSLRLSLGRAIQPNMMACHRCDNRICCNYFHLYEGTALDNNLDSYKNPNRKKKGADITHCPKGHEYSPENTLRHTKNNSRLCRACLHDNYLKKKAAL